MLTLEELKVALPKHLQKDVTQSLVDKYNMLITDSDEAEDFKKNLIGYTQVLADGKFKIEDYINAVRYVSYKMMQDSNYVAYCKVFPDRVARYRAKGKSDKDIHSLVSSYNKNKLVNLIFEQSAIPDHILNAPIRQKALNVLADIMQDDTALNKDRVAAAIGIINHTKIPEIKKIDVGVTHQVSSELAQLRESLSEFSRMAQSKVIDGTTNAKEVARFNVLKKVSDTDEDDSEEAYHDYEDS